MKTIPLCVLAFRGGCPVTEAYLQALKQAGFKPSAILAVDYVGEGARAAWLERLFGTSLAARLMRHWRNRSARIATELVERLQKNQSVRLKPGQEPCFEAFAEQVHYLTVRNYSDPCLREAMRASGAEVFLYCSGGKVPEAIFDEGFRILHIHPGVVPDVRGSDGLLWSIVARQKPGASCFYMDAGIDTGRLIMTAEFPLPHWEGPSVDPDILYNALIYCYDPHLRAALLIDVLNGPGLSGDLANLPATRQTHLGGHYFTMHRAIRERVLSQLCV